MWKVYNLSMQQYFIGAKKKRVLLLEGWYIWREYSILSQLAQRT